MTAIFYPDCTATPLNGKFTLEARSPDNGTINHRNGSPPSEDDFGFKYREHQDEFLYRLIDNTRSPSLLKRFATPEEVAALVVYVCSPRASATNGAALRVDGGVVRSVM